MKPKAHAFLLVILAAALVSSVLPSRALAQDWGVVPVWLVPFMRSLVSDTVNSATTITLSNQGTTTCFTSVQFRDSDNALACTTFIELAPGQTRAHCSRWLGYQVASCYMACSPLLLGNEGKAVVSMSPAACKSKVAVDARVFYTDWHDASVQAVAPINVIKIGKSNTGD